MPYPPKPVDHVQVMGIPATQTNFVAPVLRVIPTPKHAIFHYHHQLRHLRSSHHDSEIAFTFGSFYKSSYWLSNGRAG
ncbi:hypothetical protein PILCRDRAFT_186785 [Piloderma croceum F 1598]|uniref:Uncharacterized protein n=1 Tax=Piloderma croceum (strain F 1598) TaxID=765440 RepID=A0A0C3GIR1_PILCF|nr:hypothetical protein PILCRDRAFT_186785 [Piloderma croceum F 1598]